MRYGGRYDCDLCISGLACASGGMSFMISHSRRNVGAAARQCPGRGRVLRAAYRQWLRICGHTGRTDQPGYVWYPATAWLPGRATSCLLSEQVMALWACMGRLPVSRRAGPVAPSYLERWRPRRRKSQNSGSAAVLLLATEPMARHHEKCRLL